MTEDSGQRIKMGITSLNTMSHRLLANPGDGSK
jgi:hypothetical protein